MLHWAGEPKYSGARTFLLHARWGTFRRDLFELGDELGQYSVHKLFSGHCEIFRLHKPALGVSGNFYSVKHIAL